MSNFHKQSTGGHGRAGRCRFCISFYNKKIKKFDAEKIARRPTQEYLKERNMLWCSFCECSYPKTEEYFCRKRKSESELRSVCKRCSSIKDKLYYRSKSEHDWRLHGNYNRSLTDEQVREIRRIDQKYFEEHGAYSVIARRYGVNRRTIKNVRDGVYYKWLK